MRKLISIALVLVMVFSVAAISCSALVSPKADNYYSVSTESEGKGTATADKNKVDKDGDEIITLTATENGGYFTKWIMTGDYEIIEGDEYSPVFVIKAKADVTAVASFSILKDELSIIIDVLGDGSVDADHATVKKNSDGTVTLVAVEKTKKFVEWILACEYEIIEGSLTTKTLTIKPLTDIHVTAVFGEENVPASSGDNAGDSSTSPKTGDASMMIIAMIMMAMFVGGFAVKKIKE